MKTPQIKSPPGMTPLGINPNKMNPPSLSDYPAITGRPWKLSNAKFNWPHVKIYVPMETQRLNAAVAALDIFTNHAHTRCHDLKALAGVARINGQAVIETEIREAMARLIVREHNEHAALVAVAERLDRVGVVLRQNVNVGTGLTFKSALLLADSIDKVFAQLAAVRK